MRKGCQFLHINFPFQRFFSLVTTRKTRSPLSLLHTCPSISLPANYPAVLDFTANMFG